MTISQKYLSNETRASILVRYVISREICLHDFGGIDVYYISNMCFEKIAAVDTN